MAVSFLFFHSIYRTYYFFFINMKKKSFHKPSLKVTIVVNKNKTFSSVFWGLMSLIDVEISYSFKKWVVGLGLSLKLIIRRDQRWHQRREGNLKREKKQNMKIILWVGTHKCIDKNFTAGAFIHTHTHTLMHTSRHTKHMHWTKRTHINTPLCTQVHTHTHIQSLINAK